MAPINWEPQRWTVTVGDFNYEANARKDGKIALLRWPRNEVRIPTRTYVWTENGWEHSMKLHGRQELFSDWIDVNDVIINR